MSLDEALLMTHVRLRSLLSCSVVQCRCEEENYTIQQSSHGMFIGGGKKRREVSEEVFRAGEVGERRRHRRGMPFIRGYSTCT